MEALTPEENLIAHVARATCLAYRIGTGEVPESDVRLYVDELVSLFRRKPNGVLVHADSNQPPGTLVATLEFCANQLEGVAPDQSSRLRSALSAA
jgi:hypothetical protein